MPSVSVIGFERTGLPLSGIRALATALPGRRIDSVSCAPSCGVPSRPGHGPSSAVYRIRLSDDGMATVTVADLSRHESPESRRLFVPTIVNAILRGYAASLAASLRPATHPDFGPLLTTCFLCPVSERLPWTRSMELILSGSHGLTEAEASSQVRHAISLINHADPDAEIEEAVRTFRSAANRLHGSFRF